VDSLFAQESIVETYETGAYFGAEAKQQFTSDSPFLVSSSMWLNDARFREAVATHSLRRNHARVPGTFDITEMLPLLQESWIARIGQIEELFVRERQKNKALDAWFEERFLSTLKAETLKDYPFNSVGNLYYRFVVANDYVAEFDSGLQSSTHFEYFQKRLSQQHDLEHLLGGFGFELIGEQAVTWMRHAAYFRHLSPQLAGILNETYAFLLMPPLMRTMLHYPQTMETVWDAISQGVLVGRMSEPIFMMKYEPILHLPVEEARKILGFRNTKDLRIRDIAQQWAEYAKDPLDPRLGEDLEAMAKKLGTAA
jgi:ubiquinone biosynthesis protein Coq4